MSVGNRIARGSVALLALLVCGAAVHTASVAAASAPAAMSFTETYLSYETGTARTEPQVWAAGPSGQPPKLLGIGEQPLLAPDGRLVAASSAQPGVASSLAVYSVAGAPVQRYGNVAQAEAQPLAWSPDSKYLAVALMSSSVTNIAKRSSIAVIDVETGVTTTIARGIPQGASFAPDGSDRLAYAVATSLREGARANVYVVAPDGSGKRQLTHDGRSLNPVWGSSGIAFDRERLRHLEFPILQIWLMSPSGGRARQITHVRVGSLVSGLVPIAFSADGSKLLAEFEGQDTSAAWSVTVATGRARMLTAGRHSLTAAGISQDGTTVLLDEDSFESPPSAGQVVTMPFAGGPTRVLVAHAGQASWTG